VTEHAATLSELPQPDPGVASGALVRLRRHAWLLGWWAAGRVVVLVAAVAVHLFGPEGYLHAQVRGSAFGLLDSWDASWYRMIAGYGYLLVPGRQSDPAFFPLFPLLLRVVHPLGLGYGTAGILISNVALLVALAVLYALTRDLLGESLARRATIYAAIFPLGFVFSMVYPESLVLALIAGSGLAALRRHWLLAAACAGGAALARPEGIFVALPLMGIAWQQWRTLTPAGRGLAVGAVAAPAAALASFPLYLNRVLHDPLAWSHAEHGWGRHFTPLGIVDAFAQLPGQVVRSGWALRDVVFLFVYLVLLVFARRAGAPWLWLAAAVAIVVLPAFSASFMSIGRFGLLAPPVFWGLAEIGRRRNADRVIRAVSIALLVAATVTVPFVFP
jgi:hypothetical protein